MIWQISEQPARHAPPTMPPCPATKAVLPLSSNGVFAIGDLPLRDRKIARHHFLDELRETRLRYPAELFARLAGVADQEIDFGRTKIRRVDANQRLAGRLVDAGFLDAPAAPFDAAANLGKGKCDEFAHRAGFTGRQHEIVGLVRLQYLVHALDVVPGMAPVALCLEISEIERLVQTGLDPGNPAGDLARHKRLAADRALMVEQ